MTEMSKQVRPHLFFLQKVLDVPHISYTGWKFSVVVVETVQDAWFYEEIVI
jgi:hypothetical protein